ncbi:MAG: hypothetical protein H6Q74_187 [Firmicutes bacterium]|nr:hypothetical protein [Bacillota bacterium]
MLFASLAWMNTGPAGIIFAIICRYTLGTGAFVSRMVIIVTSSFYVCTRRPIEYTSNITLYYSAARVSRDTIGDTEVEAIGKNFAASGRRNQRLISKKPINIPNNTPAAI